MKCKSKNNKLIPYLIMAGCAGCILPLALISRYARPSGDDFGYSAASHVAWVTTHSIWAVLQAGIETTKNMCITWNGDWFSVFIFTWMPEVFVAGSFPMVPLFFMFANIAITLWLCHEILSKRLEIGRVQSLAIGSIVLAFEYLFIPSTACILFWWVGVVHYMLPHFFAMLSLIYLSKYARIPKKKYLVLLSLLAIGIGGSSYYSYFMILFVYLLVILSPFWKEKSKYYVFIPLIIGTICVVIQIIMPGNRARVSGLTYEAQGAISTIFRALLVAAQSPIQYCQEQPLLGIGLVFLAIIIAVFMGHIGSKFAFPYPILFIGYMFGIYAAMFTPEIYADTAISGGPGNMEYITFLLTFCAALIYAFGWWHSHYGNSKVMNYIDRYKKQILACLLLFFVLSVVIFRHDVKNTRTYEAVEYYTSGRADDFKNQIASQMEILLDDTIKEAYLCPTNPVQGPLFHMPVIADPDAFTNSIVAQFYQKDFVIAK